MKGRLQNRCAVSKSNIFKLQIALIFISHFADYTCCMFIIIIYFVFLLLLLVIFVVVELAL